MHWYEGSGWCPAWLNPVWRILIPVASQLSINAKKTNIPAVLPEVIKLVSFEVDHRRNVSIIVRFVQKGSNISLIELLRSSHSSHRGSTSSVWSKGVSTRLYFPSSLNLFFSWSLGKWPFSKMNTEASPMSYIQRSRQAEAERMGLHKLQARQTCTHSTTPLPTYTHTKRQAEERLLGASGCTVYLSCCHSFTHYNLQTLIHFSAPLHQPKLKQPLIYHIYTNNKDCGQSY